MKHRDTLLYRFKKHGKPEDFKMFTKYRNLVQRELKSAKSEYFFFNKIEENKFDSKKLW